MSLRHHARAGGRSAIRQHPRRTLPENSVSLRQPVRHPAASSSEDESADLPSNGDVSAASVVVQAERPTPPAKRAMDQPAADQWFDDSNENAIGKTNVRFIDDDPPFYLPKQRSSEDEAEGSQERASSSQSAPQRPYGLVSGGVVSNDSSREDYRSVIDDLTIENQELKRKLRKYEGLQSAHMQDDKLFEVRVYKLSQARRRRLEGMLRDFVSGLGRSPPESHSPATLPPFTSIPYRHSTQPHAKRSGSSSSNLPVDSAYASMSASGAASSQAQQNNIEPGRSIRPAPEKRTNTTEKRASIPEDHRVQSYLQTISRRLLPKYPPVITEKTKKRLVVKRLEQLFVGRTGGDTNHSQSQQQQEVSQSAANADRRETEAMGHRVQAEGRREAEIMHRQISDLTTMAAEVSGPRTDNGTGNAKGPNGKPAMPDQRPTRPLDLDPARAQNPAENINYMKHLGFSSPKMDPTRSYSSGEGWVYLNLLISMAQLHTLNVTPTFVRNAICELSTHFEISEDGQNIRWKGGPQATKLSSDSSMNSEGSADSFVDENAGGKKQTISKAGRAGAADPDANRLRIPPHHALRPARNWPWPRAEDHFYSPMFYNPDDATSGSPTQEVSSNSLQPLEDRSGGPSGSTPLENPKSSSRGDGETGNLVFYNRARFCTDLLGDPTLPPSNVVYERHTQDMLGRSRPAATNDANSETKSVSAGLNFIAFSSDDMEMDAPFELGGFDAAFPSTTGNAKPGKPIELAVCGVGGICPADNFCIHVRKAFDGPTHEITGMIVQDLDPDPLPPPSYAFLPYSSSSNNEDSSDDDDDELDDPGMAKFAAELNERQYIPPAFLKEFSSLSGSRSTNRSSGKGSSGESSSLDMLDYARKADPERIAQQEREYEEVQQRRDEEEHAQPPGSAAATVGDRSTFFTSQEDNISVEERHLRMLKERRTGMKRESSDFGDQHPRATKARKGRAL